MAAVVQTRAGEQQSLVMSINELGVRYTSVSWITDGKCAEPSALLPVPDTVTQICHMHT